MGQKIKKLLTSEKGSITVLVVAAMLFMIVILALSFMGMSNKTSTQMSNIKQIEAEYASEQDIEQVYKETIETIDRIGDITITPNTTEWTNSDVTVTIEYQKQLTENRRAGIGSADTPNATSLTLTENGTVYAEAYTKDGHRRKASLQIKNIDKVKPTAIIRTNGGSYVMPTKGDKATIKTRVNASDLGGSGLNEVKYAWSQSKDVEPTSWQTFADGDTVTKNDCTIGTYYLWLNVTDHAGNRADTKVSNAFIVRDSSNAMDNITFKVEPDGWTKEDVKVTVIYGDNLTENRKAGPEGEDLKPNVTTVTMTENGKVVAEAEDPAGNKVVAEIDINKIDKVPPVIKTVTNPSNGNWTNKDVTVTLVAEDNLSGIKEFQWFENGEWTTRELVTSGNTGTITYTADRDTTIRFRVIDNAGNISEEKTTVLKIDKTSPTHTRAEVKNITTTGYDVYIYGVTDGTGSGVNRVQFPTWTNENWQDDLQSNWQTNANVTGVKQADGTTWVYRVNVADHKNEYGEYITDIYAYDNIGNGQYKQGVRANVPGVVITFNANGGTVTEGTRTKGYGSQMGTLPTPTRAGYTFTGWYTAATGGTRITETTTVPANNVTYYAQWTRDNYTISYNLNGGAISGQPTNYNVESNDITLPTPTKTGYTFTGWTENQDAMGYIVWKQAGFEINGNQMTMTNSESGNKFTAFKMQIWTKNGRDLGTHMGQINDNQSGKMSGEFINPHNSGEYYLRVAANGTAKDSGAYVNIRLEKGATYCYEWEVESFSESKIVAKNVKFYKKGGTTVGIPNHIITQGSTGNRSYTANWSINSYYIDINMNVDGTTHGSGYDSRVTAGFKVGGVDKGYVQDYYTQHPYGTTWEIYGLKIDGQDVAYTASGTLGAANADIKIYLNTVNFVANNSSYGTVSVANRLVVRGTNYTTSGATVTLAGGRTVTATKTDAAGYTTTFSNWTPASGTVNAATTITANFTRTANKYTISYNANGGTGSMATDTVTYNTNYTTKANAFTRTGYTFKGWNEKADGTGTDWTSWIGKPWQWTYARNVTLYAQWADTTAPTIEAYAGTMMYTDPSFASGTNSIRVYNNSANGTVTHTRKAMSDNPAGSGYGIEIKTTGAANPGHGGFYFGHATAANKEYIARIIAKIPTGYEIEWASNSYGTGGSITALTSKAGTGKWQEYLFRVKCGTTGTFSTTNFFYVKGGSTATASAPVVWQVGYATIFDTTAWGKSNYIIYTGADDGSGVVGYGVNQSDTTEPTYTTCTATSKISSISDAKTANGKYYVWVKDAAGNKAKKEVSVNYVDTVAPTFTKVEVKNLSTTGYDVYVYGVTDGTGSGVNRVQFPTWTTANSQDDIQSNWRTNASATGVKQSDGTTWVYRVNVTDHKNEYGEYNTHIYLFDNLGNERAATAPKQNVPGVTITFNANGGTVTEGTRTKGYASQIGTLPTPTRTGYTFNGWYTAATGGTKIETTTQVPASNVTYYAHWTVNSYTVTYNYAENGGKSATKTTATVNYGSAIDLSPTAAKDGYNFVGWNTNKDATSKLNSLNMSTGNVTLYAIYSKTITGTFNYFNGTAATSTPVSQTIYNKTTQVTLKAPTLANASKDSITYTARGWSTSNAANATVNVASGANVTLSSSATYYASYEATITATFYYHTGDSWTTTQSSATASAKRFMNYAGAYTQSNIAVPSAVSSSAGYVSTTYKGVSNAKSSATLVTPTTANTTYYAVYNVEITYYYYNGSAHTSSTGIRTSTTNGSAYGASVNTEPKPTAYDGANFKWWSYSPTQISEDYKRTPAGTAEKSLYAVYEKSVTATFYYHTGDNITNTQASTTASGIRNYISKSGGVNTYNGNISIPAAVTGSSTYYTTAYKGVATAVNSSTGVTPTTANTKYYAFYDCSLTYYYYNGSAHTSSTTTRRARSNGTNYVCTVDSTPTPSAYDGAAFKWWSYDANQAGSDYQRAPNATGVQALYAMYQKSITATFNYYNGTKAATTTASATRSYISKSGGINTLQANIGIPAAVSGSKGVDSTTYSHVSTSKTGSATTPNTATTTYYAVYKKTVTATKYVYNNSSSTATGTAYAYYDGTKTNASINLGTTTLSGYTPRGWSTSNAANATVNVALNGNASIMNNTTYYMSYTYGVTLTYNANNGTGAPAAQSGTAYMNYTGTKVGATITLSTTKPTRQYYTFSGWYTATSGGTKLGTTYTITGNTTIYAQWSGNVYTVTLNNQSATSAGSTAVYEKYGTGIYKETACTNQMTTSANAITKPSRSYTLTYNANGGTVSGTSTTASYTFGGYYTATGGGGDQLINANGNITTAFTTTKYGANATLYAKWARNDISLATPTRAGYIFKGWFTATSGGTQITSATSITANQTIYAQWQQSNFTVNFDLNTMNDMNKWSFIYRERFNISYDSATKLNNISVAGDSGWEIAYIPISTIAGREYTISFDYQNPNGYTALSGYQGIGYQVLSKVENLDNMSNSIATKYLATTKSGTTRLSITFKATSTTTYFAYNFGMANDGVTTTVKLGNLKISETIAYNTEIGNLPNPTMPGFTFNGWYTATSGGTKVESTAKATADVTYYAQGTANSYTQTVQVRFENVDGTFTGYSNALNASYVYGTTVSWSRAADSTYQAASITSYIVTGAKTTQVTVYRQKYYLDLNGNLDGTNGGNLGVYGKADVYINGSRVSAGVTDFYQQYRAGTTYEIKNIVANNGYVYEGVYSGTLTGTLTKTTGVSLKFVKRDTLKFTNITRDGFTVEYYSANDITAARQVAIWTSKNGQDDIVWHALDNNGGGKWSKRIYVSSHNYEYGEYNAHVYDNPATSCKVTGTVNVPYEERCYIYGVSSTGYKVRVYTNRSGVTKVEVPTWTSKNGQDDIEWISATSQGYGAYLATVKVSNHNYESGEYNSHVYLTINGSKVGIANLTANVTATAPPAHSCNDADYCNVVHSYPYAQYNYYWSSCGEWHNTCRHAICSVCGAKITTGNLAKCPNNPAGNSRACPTPGGY